MGNSEYFGACFGIIIGVKKTIARRRRAKNFCVKLGFLGEFFAKLHLLSHRVGRMKLCRGPVPAIGPHV